MEKITVAVIGGFNGNSLKNQSKKLGVNVIHHDAKSPRKKELYTIANKANSVVVISKACGHSAMDYIKEACKETKTPITFIRGTGVSSALAAGIELVS